MKIITLPRISRPQAARWSAILLAGVVAAVAIGWALRSGRVGARPTAGSPAPARPPASARRTDRAKAAGTPPAAERVVLSREQQQAVELQVAPASYGAMRDVASAPGRVAPDESHFAYITPRAAGVVRTVAAHIGQEVHAGDLLATIDSPAVAQARLELYTELQVQEVAQTEADWQETIYRNTLELIDRLKQGDTPEQVEERFEDRPVGSNRERLMTAYAEFLLSQATYRRMEQLNKQRTVTLRQYQEAKAAYQAAMATYQGLMDAMGYEVRLARLRTRQALRRAETAVRVARERLRVLGVKPDGTQTEVERGRVVGVRSDGTLPEDPKDADPTQEKPERVLPPGREKEGVKPVGAQPEAAIEVKERNAPVGTYPIWAPFDGTILDRELIVPGVAVDTTHRIFTLANLSTVWIEANVHESDFAILARSRGGDIEIGSPAYPGRTFPGEVIYTGDLVDEKSRTVKLLARAANSERLLKPGMFVEARILTAGSRQAVRVPASALLTEGDRTYLFVRVKPELFERREVESGPIDGANIAILHGLGPGEEVVTQGAFKLQSEALRLASSGP